MAPVTAENSHLKPQTGGIEHSWNSVSLLKNQSLPLVTDFQQGHTS